MPLTVTGGGDIAGVVDALARVGDGLVGAIGAEGCARHGVGGETRAAHLVGAGEAHRHIAYIPAVLPIGRGRGEAGRDHRRGAVVHQPSQFECAVAIVTDDWLVAAVQRQRGVQPDEKPGAVHGLDNVTAATGGVTAIGQLEVIIGAVPVTDNGLAAAVQRQRGETPDTTAVHGLDDVAAAAGGVTTMHHFEVPLVESK